MSATDPARLIYLGILLLVLSVVVFSRYRGRMGQGLQQAVLWLFLFAGAILLYGFKDELRQQIFPAQARVGSNGTITLTRAADRHFYATLRVDGQPIVFLVDTGATGVVLSQRDAKKIGIDTANLRYLGTANTANGAVRTARVVLKAVEFANQTEQNVPAWVNDGQMDTSLLGMSYLSRFASIEISGDTMFLKR